MPSNPAKQAALQARAEVQECIDNNVSFVVEAGAGAGKTTSLVDALEYLLAAVGKSLAQNGQRIACITFTNVASNEITARTAQDPAILSSTIHSFCWSLIQSFQPILRQRISVIPAWTDRLDAAGGIGDRTVIYDLGYRIVEDDRLFISHDDVLEITVALMESPKFRSVFMRRFPYLLIDEYQDTNAPLMCSFISGFLDTGVGPLLGLFGDHWQKIYGEGCGGVHHPKLRIIGKGANFRSVKEVVGVLNAMRPALLQQVRDPSAEGSAAIYHTNDWSGARQKGQHWGGDLPPAVSSQYLLHLKQTLAGEGWDFSPSKTKILMLTHKVLASEQGYSGIAIAFSRNEAFIKREDPTIAFLVDTLEPVFLAFESKRYGEMFNVLDRRTVAITCRADKIAWSEDMKRLTLLRSTSTIGSVLDHIRATKRPRLPDLVERVIDDAETGHLEDSEEVPRSVAAYLRLRDVPYSNVIALTRFLNDHTPFATSHGVKGLEFENVLVVAGRGWNHYDFGEMLESVDSFIPKDKEARFERNRNLFYVCCSRPRTRLVVLFTQELSDTALRRLNHWFGAENVHSAPCDPGTA